MKEGTFSQRYLRLMSGKIVNFSENEVLELLRYLDYYRINTLQIQSNLEKTTNITRWFSCKVDEITSKTYLKMQENE